MMEKPLILCVDDSSSVLDARKIMLEGNNYEVLTASSGTEALQIFITRPVDLVLLDYHMPAMNGDVAAAHMRAFKPDVPIAILSADDTVAEVALKAADAFVSKSESTNSFFEIVDRLLSQRFLFRPLDGSQPGSSANAIKG
jgi:CheY-like chemotaxis protein